MGDTEDWPRLAAFVVSARKAAGFHSRKVFGGACGVSLRTLDKLENGQPVGAATLAAAEPPLGWQPGSCRAVLAGGEPALTADPVAALIAMLPADWQGPATAFFAAIAEHNRGSEGNGPTPRAGGASG